jgi:3-phosphoshikimate 1-carboxyvinyltransferase
VFRTYDDHRLATAAAVLGLAVEGVEVENVGTTAKTLPDFPELWTRMLAGPAGGTAVGGTAGTPGSAGTAGSARATGPGGSPAGRG